MNRSRLAAVRASVRGKHPRISSGCVIGPGLVLTAGHALQPRGAAVSAAEVLVQVQLLTVRRLAPAQIVWDGRAKGLDAAVLRIAPEFWPVGVADSPVRFGRFVTLRAGQGADALGFARVQGARRADGLETAHVSGTVSPGDGMLGDHWELAVDRAPTASGASPWSGMSGAALWSGRLLCGVVVMDLAHWQHGKLQAVPAHRLTREPGFRALLRAELGHFPVVEPVELEELCEPAVPMRTPRLPSELLRPQAETVPFSGRDKQLREFRDWCADGGGLAVRLVTGLGGQGKSRFARELAVTMAAHGWLTAQLRESDAERAALVRGLQALIAVDQRMLLVMDYAETSPELVGSVLEILQARGGHHSVRIVLIARSAGEWWEQLPGATPHSAGVLGGARTVELREVATTPAERARMYHEAVEALARALPRLREPAGYERVDWAAVARVVRSRPYRDAANGSALQLHMRALLDLLTQADRRARVDRPHPDGAQAPPDVRRELLGHERRYWKRTAAAWAALDGLDHGTLADTVAVATLTRAAGPERAVELLALLPELADGRGVAAAEWLHALYPPAEGAYWGALEPDLLGEYHVALRARDNPQLLDSLLPRLRGKEAERALTVLARAAVQPTCPCPDLTGQVERLVAAHPGVLAVPAAVVAGRSENPGFLLAALRRTADRRDLPLDLLETLHAAVPDGSRLLGEQAVGLAERLARAHRRRARLTGGDLALAPVRVRADLARAEHNVAVRMSSVRRWTAAVESSSRAIRLYRRLAQSRPLEYLPLLTESLGVRWWALCELRRYPEALTDCAEAVQVNRRLVRGDSATEPAPSTEAGRTSRNRPPEPGEEAVREEAELVPHRARLAQALNNLAVVLSTQDYAVEALPIAKEAVDILEQLVQDRPTRHHLALLAAALHNYANRLSPSESALETVTRAVLIRRRLAQVHPDAHLPALVESLHNQALELARLERCSAAREVIDECLRVTLQLAEDQPAIYRPAVPAVLRTRAEVLNKTGCRVAAARSIFRALLLYRDLARTRPTEFSGAIEATLRQAAFVTWDAFADVDCHAGWAWWDDLFREAGRLADERRWRPARWRLVLGRLHQWSRIRLFVEPRRGGYKRLPRIPRLRMRLKIPNVIEVQDERTRDRRRFAEEVLAIGDLLEPVIDEETEDISREVARILGGLDC